MEHLKQTNVRGVEDARDGDPNLFTDLNRPHVLGVEKVFSDPGQSSDHWAQVGHLCNSLHKLHLIKCQTSANGNILFVAVRGS